MHHLKPSQARFITLCQQLLVLAVVAALLAPASGVLTLDVVREAPRGHASGPGASLVSATVPETAVEPEVTEIPLNAAPEKASGPKDLTSTARRAPGADAPATGAPTHVTSAAQPVTGYGAVGITWGAGQSLGEDEITLKVRTRTGQRWTGWSELEYHDEHAPDVGSADAATARPGTEPLFVGEVDDVQVSVDTQGTQLPSDLSLAVVAPGEAAAQESETPALAGDAATADSASAAATDGSDEGDAVLQSARRRTAAQPTIFSRAQWGADESMRNKKSLSYGTISAGFVHHTVNANDYTEDQVPGIIRSIYAYHVKSRGWSDIGYNFLVDRFGRIWEGRYGGIDKPVIGAHTLNYNQYSFAMSAIGNFETVQPTDAMLRAYGQLFAWKLSLHGVDPASTSQRVGRSTFQAINGHRDAGSTACPGKYLYAQLPTIRTYASEGSGPVAPTPPQPVTVTGANLQSNLAGSAYPDLVVRRASDGRGLILPTEGLTAFSSKKVAHGRGWSKRANVTVTPDVTGDGIVDLLATDSKGYLQIRPGNSTGTFGKATRVVKSTARHRMLTAVGDLNGDNRNDLVARYGSRLVTFLGAKKGGFKRVVGPKGFGGYTALVGPGDFDGDGTMDLLARTGKGGVVLHPGNGRGGFGGKQAVPGDWGKYAALAGGGDWTGDGRADIVAKATNGDVFILPQTAPGRFGAAIGPTANIRSITSVSAAGNVAGDASGDLVGIRGDKLMVLVNRGTRELGAPIDTGVSFAGAVQVLNAGDLNRDGAGDVLTRDAAGNLRAFHGNGTGTLTDAGVVASGFGSVTDLKAVGDVTGDGAPDLVGVSAEGVATVWTGNGASGFNAGAPIAGRMSATGGLPARTAKYDVVLGIQDLRLGGLHDYVARARNTGLLYLFNGTTGATSPRRPLGYIKEYDLVG